MKSISEHYSLWFQYDFDANMRVLNTLQNHLGHLPDDALKLFSHIIASHNIWNSRINGQQRIYDVWERVPITDMEEALKKNFADSEAIVQEMQNHEPVNYKNLKGDPYTNDISDIYFHVLSHNHYHRGQIARNLRENDIDPPDTNYIVFRR